MADCQCIPGCLFFNDRMADMPAMANSMKKRYCQGDNSACARYMVFSALGKEKVPADLYPSNVGKAKAILEQ